MMRRRSSLTTSSRSMGRRSRPLNMRNFIILPLLAQHVLPTQAYNVATPHAEILKQTQRKMRLSAYGMPFFEFYLKIFRFPNRKSSHAAWPQSRYITSRIRRDLDAVNRLTDPPLEHCAEALNEIVCSIGSIPASVTEVHYGLCVEACERADPAIVSLPPGFMGSRRAASIISLVTWRVRLPASSLCSVDIRFMPKPPHRPWLWAIARSNLECAGLTLKLLVPHSVSKLSRVVWFSDAGFARCERPRQKYSRCRPPCRLGTRYT